MEFKEKLIDLMLSADQTNWQIAGSYLAATSTPEEVELLIAECNQRYRKNNSEKYHAISTEWTVNDQNFDAKMKNWWAGRDQQEEWQKWVLINYGISV